MPSHPIRIIKRCLPVFICLFCSSVHAQDMNALVEKLKTKLDQVKDYTAEGMIKTDVAFIKAPVGKVKVYYKQPDHFRLQKEKGISLLPRGGVSVNMRSILSVKDFVAIGAGKDQVDGVPVTVVKVIPSGENNDIVLSTLYIDEARLLVLKAITTTRDNGTYEISMRYGKYAAYGLPDKLSFAFNTKDYKLPKGVTLEFEDEAPPAARNMKNKKGRIEITYHTYTINQGVPDQVFGL
ncbi:MAG TPA: hypothetical protein VG842_10545 [Sediminibacterium sp.]|nr:hypothetical protein [Sediminibacterium sp.]